MTERVLLICRDANKYEQLMERLTAEGFEVIGPAPNAGAALCLASVTYPDLALVACPPGGRRDAAEMASALARNWGVGTIILRDALTSGVEANRETRWLARPDQFERMARVLSGEAFDAQHAA